MTKQPTRCTAVVGVHCVALLSLMTTPLEAQPAAQAREPEFDVRGVELDGELRFEYAVGATRLSDGTIVIADGTAPAVRFFHRSGQQVRTVGREGSGPGEFRLISWLGQCSADSVFVWDFMQLRLSIIDRDGQVVAQHRIPAGSSSGPPPAVIACSRRGTLAYLARPDLMGTRKGPDIVRVISQLSVANTRGRVLQQLGEVPLAEFSYTVGQYRPLGRQTSIAVGSDRVYVGTQDSAAVDVYTLDGRRVATWPTGGSLRPAAPRHYDAAIERQVAWIAEADLRRRIERQLRHQLPIPDHLPPYSGLFTGPDGILWVQLSAPGDAETWLRAIGSEGQVLKDVSIPVELRVFEVGDTYVLGAYEEPTGEPHVAMYPIP